MSDRLTVREAAKKRMPLSGVDAEALEGALQVTERERDLWKRRWKSLQSTLADDNPISMVMLERMKFVEQEIK